MRKWMKRRKRRRRRRRRHSLTRKTMRTWGERNLITTLKKRMKMKKRMDSMNPLKKLIRISLTACRIQC